MVHNMVGGGGKTGAILTVSGDAGATVTVTKDSKTYTRAINSDGIAVFKGLETGTWSLTMSKDGEDSVTDDVEITSDYSHSMTFFRSYINVTYPAGSILTCTHTDGTVYTADTDTGSYTFVIKEPGTWTILSTNNIQSDSGSIEITASGQNKNLTLKYFAAYINVTAPSGSTLTCVNGNDSQVYTLGSSETAHTFTVFGTGTYTITGIRGAQTDSKAVEITGDEQSESVTLQYFVAYIKVTVKGAPGSTDLSCSDGANAYNYTLSANGTYQFTVYNSGTWTITGSRSDQTKTATVEVTTNGNIYSVTLFYKLVLFDYGDKTSVTGGWNASKVRFKKVSGQAGGVVPTVKTNSDGSTNVVSSGAGGSGSYITVKAIDLTGYSTVRFIGSVTESSGEFHTYSGFAASQNLTEFLQPNSAASMNFPNEASTSYLGTENFLDISGLSGAYYFVFGVYNATKVKIEKLWLE